jgi:uncharacterized protein with beta-barrel porin domain
MRWGRRVQISFLALLFLPVAALCGAGPVWGADLEVDTGLGNSPYNVTSNIGYDNESAGITPQGGIMNQTAFTNAVNDTLNVGLGNGAKGTYNLGGTGGLQALGTSAGFSWEYVGLSGAEGTFNQTGGTNTITGGSLFVGTGILGTGKATTGTYNLSGGSIFAGRLLEASGAELIGDSGAKGTFNQTGGQNICNNGVFIGSDAEWRYSGTVHSSGTGVYNLSGAGSVLNTSGNAITIDGAPGDGGEVVGDGGGTGTFNQSGGTNIATDGGLAVGADIYGSGVGGVGTFNLDGGSLTASGLPKSVGGEVIGTNRGFGTFNQAGGTNTVQAGLFVGSNVTYPLADITPVGGTGVYNLSGGSLSASGKGTLGSKGYVPGEDIGDAGGKGTFNQTGGTNTVTQRLFVGSDVFNSGKGGTGAYNLSGAGSVALDADYEIIGDGGGTGTFTQTGGTNTVATSLFVGSDVLGTGRGGTGTYNLGGTGSLNVSITSVPASWEYVGVSGGTGTFNQSGGTNTMQGGILFVGTDVLGSGKAGTGTYNLSGGLILSTRHGVGTNAGPGTGVEAIGDSGGNGTFNQTGGTNNCNNGVFVGSDTQWVYYHKVHTGGIGVYNLSGADSVLITSGAVAGDARGGEVVGDGGGIGTFNQTGGTNNATWSGLAVGSDIYGSGVGGVGVFNLSGGSLAASPLPESITQSQAIGGEIIGTTRGIGTLNQSGGTNAVQAGLFVGSAINYALQNNVRAGGTGVYNLSGGSLAASGSGTFGSSAYIPGEDLGDAGGKGTFNQTGGTNTLTQGLLIGSDVFHSGTVGTGAYNLLGGSLQADFEWVGGSGAGTFTQTGGINTVTGKGASYGIEMNGGTYRLNGGTLIANSFDGNLDNEGGTFAPSQAGSLFTGNYTQGKNSVLQMDIASSGSYNWLDMANTGKAAFNGGTIEPVLEGGFVPVPGETFNVVKNAQSITGTPTVANFTATLVGTVENLPDPGIAIIASRNYTNSVLTLTQNQRQVGNMLNRVSATTTGDLGTVLHAIDSIPASQAGSVAGVYQQISPDMAASLANLGFAASSFFQQDLNQRITSLRYAGLAGEQAAVLQGAGPSATAQGNGWNFYADPQVSWGSQSSTANETGYNFSIGGLTAGADYRVCDDLLVGAASGYAHTDAGFYNMGNVQNDTVPVNFYAAYFPGNFYAYGSAGYAVNLFSTNRQLAFFDRTATASTTGNMLNGYAETGYDLRAGNLVLTPMASLAYSSLWIDGFGETGADSLDLNVGSQHAQSLQLGPGLRLAGLLKCGRAVVAPQLYANYEHEFSNNSRTIDAGLAQAGIPFGFQSQQLGTDFAMLGASITVFSGKSFSVRLDSNVETGRANYSACMVDAGLAFRF